MTCWCGAKIEKKTDAGACASCALYNAAVVAQKAAANCIAQDAAPDARDAWLNEYGVFAFVDGIATQLGSAAQARPFVELTGAARAVSFNKE